MSMKIGLEGGPTEPQLPNRLPPHCIDAIRKLSGTGDPYAPKIEKISAKQTIIQQDEKGTDIFILLSGSLEVRARIDGQDTYLDTLSGEGVFVGGIAAIFNNPDEPHGVIRTASVLTIDDCELVKVPREKFAEWNFMPGALAESFAIITDTERDRVRGMSLSQLRDAGFPWAQDHVTTQAPVAPEPLSSTPQEQVIFEPQRFSSSTPLLDRIRKAREGQGPQAAFGSAGNHL